MSQKWILRKNALIFFLYAVGITYTKKSENEIAATPIL